MTNQELRDEYKSLFEIYDRDQTGGLTHAEFKTVISDAGIELGEEDLAGILAGQPDAITCEIFTQVLSDCCKPPHTEAEVITAFKVFDKAGTGKADYAELNYVFEVLGDGISDKMIHGFMHLSHPDESGGIDYANFSKRLLAAPDPNEKQPEFVKPKPAEETEEEIMAVINAVHIDKEADTSEWGKFEPGEVSSMEWVGHFMQDGVRLEMSIPHMVFTTTGLIEGHGKDDDGDFTIEGTLTGEGTFAFVKKYDGATMECKGVMRGVTMEGTWNWINVEVAEGNTFEINLSTTHWTGWFCQDDKKDEMTVDLAVGCAGAFFGFGHDDNGAFVMRGTWQAVTGEEDTFNFVKTYVGKHSLKYFGRAKGEFGSLSVRGKWTMVDGEGEGAFHLKEQADKPAEDKA